MSVDNNGLSWTVAQLLSDVRRKARIPAGSIDWADDVLMREASDVIWSLAGWALKLAGDGRLSFSFDRSVVASILSGPYRGSDEFLLPPLAVADTVENVVWVQPDGLTEKRLELIDVAEQADIAPSGSTSGPLSYAFTNGRIRVYPAATTGSGSLRFNYQRRHGELIADSSQTAPTVTSASDAGGGFTTFNAAGGSPFAPGDFVDLVNGQYPYRSIFADLGVGAVSGVSTTIYVPYAYVPTGTDLAGMRLVRAGQSPFVSLPLECRGAMAYKTAAAVALGIGDFDLAAAMDTKAADDMGRFIQMVATRTTSDRRKVINRNSPMRARARFRGRGR